MRSLQVKPSISLSEVSNIQSEAHDESSLAPSSASITTSSSSSLSSSSLLTRLSQASHIRCRLLYRLGIDPKQPIERKIKPVGNPMYDRFSTKIDSTPHFQPLREDVNKLETQTRLTTFTTSVEVDLTNCNDDNYGRTSNSTVAKSLPKCIERIQTASSITSNLRRVRFDNKVMVVRIPSRNAYSSRIKKALWRNKSELKDIADRNRCEYLAEGWEWRKAVEDEDMYIEAATGEKIHPCWVEDEEDKEFEGLERRDSFYGDPEETKK